MTELTFRFEPLARALLYDGFALIAEQHWREIALDTDKVPLAIDWAGYLAREKQGLWKALVARRDGRMIGYIAFNLHHPDRYRNTLYIQEDTIWVLPSEKNRGIIWRALWKHALAALPRPAKVQGKIRYGRSGYVAGKILKSLGLEPVEIVHSAYME